MIAALAIAAAGLVLCSSVLFLRSLSAQLGQHPAQVYELSFPMELEADLVQRFLNGLSGLLLPWYRRWLYQPAIAFETRATSKGIAHFLITPTAIAPTVEAILGAHVPSVRYQPVEHDPSPTWNPDHLPLAAAEYAASTNARQLRCEPEELATGLLSGLQPLEQSEQVVIQWLLTPASPVHPPRLSTDKPEHPASIAIATGTDTFTTSEAVSAMRTKQTQPLLQAVARIVVVAATHGRAIDLLRHVEAPWHGARNPGVQLRRRMLPQSLVIDHAHHRTLPLLHYPLVLGSGEAAGLVGWPVALTSLPGLTLGGCRLLPVPAQIPEEGTLLGYSTYPATAGRPYCLDAAARSRHLWVCGPTGAGKSTLLARMAADDIAAGHGLVVLDPKGDLLERIAERIPESRWDDVIILDAADDTHPVGYNPLKCTATNRELVVEQVLGVMRKIWSTSWGPRLDEIVRGCLLTLTSVPGMTLAELPALLTDDRFRQRLLSGLHDPFGVEGFWATFNSWSKAEVATNTSPALNKIRAFAMRSRLRGVLGQADGAIDFNQVIANRQIVLVDLAAGKLGTEAAYLLGALLFAGLWDAVSARAGMPADQRPLVAAYLDEFQNLVALPTPAETMLAEGRSYGLALTLSHQHLGQLDSELTQAMLANCRSKLVMQASHHDGQVFAKELGGALTPEDLMGIAAYEAVVSGFAEGRSQPPATVALPELAPATGDVHRLKEHARERFGVPRSQVDSAIAARQGTGGYGRSGHRSTPNAPSSGGYRSTSAPPSQSRRPRR